MGSRSLTCSEGGRHIIFYKKEPTVKMPSSRSSYGAWARPVTRTYGYNFTVGQNYYVPMTQYLEAKYSAPSGEKLDLPGGMTYSERVANQRLITRSADYMYSSASAATSSMTASSSSSTTVVRS